jgi:hypothetical protein
LAEFKCNLVHRRNRKVKIDIKGSKVMLSALRNGIVYIWNYVFNHRVSPLRNIEDVAIRHYVLQMLGVMWAVSFSLSIGSYTFLTYSIIGHTILIAAAAITVGTWTAASLKPELFTRGNGRRKDGEHD